MQDLLPTILEFCGVKAPEAAHFDGISLAKVLRGQGQVPERKLVVQYSRAKLTKWECAVIWNQWRLVEGKELYNMTEDRAQEHDLAAKNPEIVAQLRDYYEDWWKNLGDEKNKFVATSIGSDVQPVVNLTSSDWQDIYADNSKHVRNAIGGPRGGHWNISVEQAGEYEISIRRWPAEVNTALNAAFDAESKALPITGATLTVASQEFSVQSKPEDKQITFPKTSFPPAQLSCTPGSPETEGQITLRRILRDQ